LKFTTHQLKSCMQTFSNFPISWNWQILVNASLMPAPWLNQFSERSMFYHFWFSIQNTGLMKICQQLMQTWWRPFSVQKFSVNFLNFDLHNIFGCKTWITTSAFFANHCLLLFINILSDVPVNDISSRHP